ncbi:50S ribosomal protein like [Actinidia chinensis var. chinensis]|uniref:50S ribosomal protein like n=1 Tax=Actinidia chinensis var. chinensis TaxID=1590841 RepID=A0A2R6QY39_ACTCC|nr:50S ribosomal protein like [Actinidia chinensis var. chinensis]
MSVSAVFGPKMVTLPNPPSLTSSRFRYGGAIKAVPRIDGCGGGLVIECSSRPQKKATAHHMKTRPRKTQPWDIRRKPAVYPPLPPLPPEWSFAPADDSAAQPPPPLKSE